MHAQGEYVCVSQLEATYTAGSQAVAQMFMYGNSLREYLLAVVVPTSGVHRSLSLHVCMRKTWHLHRTACSPGKLSMSCHEAVAGSAY